MSLSASAFQALKDNIRSLASLTRWARLFNSESYKLMSWKPNLHCLIILASCSLLLKVQAAALYKKY